MGHMYDPNNSHNAAYYYKGTKQQVVSQPSLKCNKISYGTHLFYHR